MKALLVGEGTRAEALATALRRAGVRVDLRSEEASGPQAGRGDVGMLPREILDLERLLTGEPPDAVLVASDGDAALAAAIVATKLVVPLATLGEPGSAGREAEVNRTLLTSLADARLADDPQTAASWVAGT